MRKKLFVLLLAAVFLFTQAGAVYAKGFSGGRSKSFSSGRSFSSKSSGYSGSKSSSKSFFGSSSSKSKSSSSKGSSSGSGGYSGSSSSNNSSSSSKSYSGSSSSRSVPKSYSAGKSYSGSSSSGTSGSTKPKSSKTSTAKSSYLQSAYKKQVSQNNYTAYKQKLNNDQKKVYESSFNKSYRMNNRMSFENAMRTRPQRINMFNSRPIVVNVNPVMFGSPFSYGYAFVGPWDLWFLMRASEMFWYHHWKDIYPYRDYFEAQKFAEMERRIRQLEMQNVQRDESYLDPNVDPDLQLTSDYQEKNLDSMYYTDKYPDNSGNPVATLIVIVLIIGVFIIVIRKVTRPKSKGSNGGSIY